MQGSSVTRWPGTQAHRRVPRPGAIGNAVRAAHQDRRRPEMRSSWAARTPHLAETALCRCLRPPLLAMAQAQQPHDAQESDEQAPGAAHRRSPPTALCPRRRAWLTGAGRAPAEVACACPAPRSALRPPSSALPPPLRTCDSARLCPREPRAAAFLRAPLTHPPPVHLACSSSGAKTRSFRGRGIPGATQPEACAVLPAPPRSSRRPILSQH